MACAGAPSFDPPAGGCPVSPDQQTVAWGFIAATAVVTSGGLFLFWLRRREPLVAKRDWVSATFCVLVTVLTQLSCYFAQSMPCWAYYLVNYCVSALVPGLMMTRFFGLYTRHLRQDEIAHRPAARPSLAKFSGAAARAAALSVDSSPRVTPLAGSDDAGDAVFFDATTSVGVTQRESAAGSSTHGPPTRARAWYALYSDWLAPRLLHYRFDSPRRSVLIALLTCVPWAVYGAIRFASSPSHRSTATGCQFDRVDVSMIVVISCLATPTGMPAVAHLLQIPDSLLLRYEGLLMMFLWPPFVAWLLTDLSLPDGAHTALHGIYGILIGWYLLLGCMLWLPALMTYSRRRKRIVFPLGLRIVATHEKMHASAFSTSARPEVTTACTALPVVSSGVAANGLGESSVYVPAGRMAPIVPLVVASPESSSTPVRASDRSAQAGLPAMADHASRFVFPAPAPEELLATLRMPISEVRESSRAIGVTCAMLFATDSGRALLYETLRLDLSAEFLGFLVDCEELRLAAEEWLTHLMVARNTAEAPSGANLPLLSSISLNLSLLLARYVEFNAPHYVSISSTEAAVLSKAALLLPSLLTRISECGADSAALTAESAAVAAIEGVLVALANAEVDVFELIADPLRLRMVSRADLFEHWATGVLRVVSTPPRTGQPVAC